MARFLPIPVLLGVLAVTACSGGVTDGGVTPPPRDSTTITPPGGTIQRSALSAQIRIDPADAALAQAANVSLAGLSVRLLRDGTPATSATATTDANGVARFENLLEGRYSLTVERVLTTAEQARLPADDRDASVFAGGTTVDIAPPQPATAQLELVASRRGSLVISEQYGYTGDRTIYNWGMYMEFYNNSDTTVYMDGMLLVRGSFRLRREGHAPCSDPVYTRYRRDTTRFWVELGIQFPGGGRDFPIAPGRAAVYAQDAANHVTASGSDRFLDLSRATFEGIGFESDLDNPIAANVRPIFGTSPGGAGGRGTRTDSHDVWVLVKPSALARAESVELQRVTPPPVGGVVGTGRFTIYGIPRDEILDVMALGDSPGYRAYMASTTIGDQQPCAPEMEAVYDRASAPISDYRMPIAARRRAIGRTADGRLILMRTHTSARDIESTTRLRERFP